MRGLSYRGGSEPRPTARRRLAWEVRKRTSIETRLNPTTARWDDPSLFETPFIYWSGDKGFTALTEPEVLGLRRFVQFGGFVFVDDASAGASTFVQDVRRELARAFPNNPLRTVASNHTIYRSFYLLDGPVGRVSGTPFVEAVFIDDRAAVVVSRHDVGGALARDNLGTWEYPVTPGGAQQRESAIRFAVNLVMYALCLDYKDDQVHAPFIMRRRGGMP